MLPTSLLSRIWLGTWSLGGEGFGQVDLRESRHLLQSAADAGICQFDTAAFYAHGKSIKLLGEVFSKNRRLVRYAAKAGLSWDKNTVRHSANPQQIRQTLRESLGYLKTSYLDIFLLHWPDSMVPIEKSVGEFNQIYLEKLCLRYGVCNLDIPDLNRLKQVGLYPQMVQNRINPLAGKELTISRHANRLFKSQIMGYSPLEQGLLGTSSTNQGPGKLGKRDIRRKNPHFHQKDSRHWAEGFHTLCRKKKLSPLVACYAWILSRKPEVSLIIGPKTCSQFEENLKAFTFISTTFDICEKTGSFAFPSQLPKILGKELYQHIRQIPETLPML